MSEEIKSQREGYVTQMQQVEDQLKQLDTQKARLAAQREQLKGAVFALDSLAQATTPPELVKGEDTSDEPSNEERSNGESQRSQDPRREVIFPR